MSKFEKLLDEIRTLSKDVRFEKLKIILEYYGYTLSSSKHSGSHYVFRKSGKPSITIPKHNPVKVAYVKIIKDMIEKEKKDGR